MVFISFYRINVILCTVQRITHVVILILLLRWMELAVVSDMYVSRIFTNIVI
jgi:hypothetical protein